MSDERRRGGRRLTHAENELWRVVTTDVRPFRPRVPSAEPLTVSKPPAAPQPLAITMERPKPASKAAAPIEDIDHRTMTKIRRGRLEVDAKLDLHGMRQAEAQRALVGFLRRAQAEGSRVVIVVTGKGLTRDDSGVLRRVVPMWLESPTLRDLVIGFGSAARHHGGEGALYVRIRRAGRL